MKLVVLTTPDAVIDAFGDTTREAAKALATTPQVLDNWRRRGSLPKHLFLVVNDRLGKIGKIADPSVFGIKHPEAAE